MTAPENTLTLALQGDVSLDDLASALAGFRDLVNSLTEEVDPACSVRWLIENLETGSAIATARGDVSREDDRPKVVEVIRRYEHVGQALEARGPFPFSTRIAQSAQQILRVIEGGRVRAVRFETAAEDHEVSADSARADVLAPPATGAKKLQPALGAVRGRVQSISNRGGLRFTLYDLIEDRAVSCYLEPGQDEGMRDAWGKCAVVEGLVRRDAATGRATVVRRARVTTLPEAHPRGFREAIGAAPPVRPGGMSPEEAVRKTRDA